jgi:hypothetical protein
VRTLLGLVLMLAGLVACEAARSEPTPTPPSAVEVRIPTAAQPAVVCEMAVIHGRLVEDARWGVALADPAGKRSRVTFPFAYRAFVEGDRVAIVDGTGQVVARTGDMIDAAGGLGDALGVDQAYIDCGPIQVVG